MAELVGIELLEKAEHIARSNALGIGEFNFQTLVVGVLGITAAYRLWSRGTTWGNVRRLNEVYGRLAEEHVADATRRLIRKGRRSVGPLLRRLKTASGSNSSYARNIVFTLGAIGDSRATEPLLAFMEEHDYFADEVLTAIGQIGDERAVHPLLQLIYDVFEKGRDAKFNDEAVMYAAEALWKTGSEDEGARNIAVLWQQMSMSPPTGDAAYESERQTTILRALKIRAEGYEPIISFQPEVREHVERTGTRQVPDSPDHEYVEEPGDYINLGDTEMHWVRKDRYRDETYSYVSYEVVTKQRISLSRGRRVDQGVDMRSFLGLDADDPLS